MKKVLTFIAILGLSSVSASLGLENFHDNNLVSTRPVHGGAHTGGFLSRESNSHLKRDQYLSKNLRAKKPSAKLKGPSGAHFSSPQLPLARAWNDDKPKGEGCLRNNSDGGFVGMSINVVKGKQHCKK